MDDNNDCKKYGEYEPIFWLVVGFVVTWVVVNILWH